MCEWQVLVSMGPASVTTTSISAPNRSSKRVRQMPVDYRLVRQVAIAALCLVWRNELLQSGDPLSAYLSLPALTILHENLAPAFARHDKLCHKVLWRGISDVTWTRMGQIGLVGRGRHPPVGRTECAICLCLWLKCWLSVAESLPFRRRVCQWRAGGVAMTLNELGAGAV